MEYFSFCYSNTILSTCLGPSVLFISSDPNTVLGLTNYIHISYLCPSLVPFCSDLTLFRFRYGCVKRAFPLADQWRRTHDWTRPQIIATRVWRVTIELPTQIKSTHTAATLACISSFYSDPGHKNCKSVELQRTKNTPSDLHRATLKNYLTFNFDPCHLWYSHQLSLGPLAFFLAGTFCL